MPLTQQTIDQAITLTPFYSLHLHITNYLTMQLSFWVNNSSKPKYVSPIMTPTLGLNLCANSETTIPSDYPLKTGYHLCLTLNMRLPNNNKRR